MRGFENMAIRKQLGSRKNESVSIAKKKNYLARENVQQHCSSTFKKMW